MTAKCERCGKFRADKDWLYVWHGDQDGGEVAECRWCMSPADAEAMAYSLREDKTDDRETE